MTFVVLTLQGSLQRQKLRGTSPRTKSMGENTLITRLHPSYKDVGQLRHRFRRQGGKYAAIRSFE